MNQTIEILAEADTYPDSAQYDPVTMEYENPTPEVLYSGPALITQATYFEKADEATYRIHAATYKMRIPIETVLSRPLVDSDVVVDQDGERFRVVMELIGAYRVSRSWLIERIEIGAPHGV